MSFPIVKYGNPVLRKKGAPIEDFSAATQTLIDEMFDTMYKSRGLGLAAQQIGKALLLTVIDVRGAKDRPSTLELHGEAAPVDSFMPLVLINPQIKPEANAVAGPEGCLSFPEIFADITRPAEISVTALDRHGKKIQFKCGGLLARAIQHEVDHLNGILFIDRMSMDDKEQFREELKKLQAEGRKE